MTYRLVLYLIFLILVYSCQKETFEAISGKYGFNYITVVKDYPENGNYVFRIQYHLGDDNVSINELTERNDSLIFKNIYRENFQYEVYTKRDSFFYVQFFDKNLKNEIHPPYYAILNSHDTIYRSEITENEGFKINKAESNDISVLPYQLTDTEIVLDSVKNESMIIIIKSNIPLTGYGNTKYSFRSYEFSKLEVKENDTLNDYLLIQELFGFQPQSINRTIKSSKEMRKLTKGWRIDKIHF